METKGKLRTAGEWIEIAKQMKEAGVLFLLLTGGEPLLYAEFREVYLALKEMGMIITLNTNGTMIDEKWADFFGKTSLGELMLLCMARKKQLIKNYVIIQMVFKRQ